MPEQCCCTAADPTGLTDALEQMLPQGPAVNFLGRGTVLVQLVVAMVLGAGNLSGVEALPAHQAGVFGPPASDSTLRRLLESMDAAVLFTIARARRRIRWHVWTLLYLRTGGFPWLTVAGNASPGGSSSTSTPRS